MNITPASAVPAAPASSQMPSLCGSRDEGWLWRQVWIVCWGEGMVRHGLQRESSFRSCPSQKSRVEPPAAASAGFPCSAQQGLSDMTTGCCEEEEPFTPPLYSICCTEDLLSEMLWTKVF